VVVFLSDNGGTNANTEYNFPFRGTKGTFYEGGLRTPLIVRWKGIVPPGTNDDVASEVDLFPTLATLANAQIPGDIDGIPLDLPGTGITDKARPRHDTRSLYWELASSNFYSFSVLSPGGRWRLVNGELFDLAKDPSGTTDVASRHPGVVTRLTKQFFEWQAQASRVGAKVDRIDGAKGELRGDSFRRVPGAGAYTLAIGVTPEHAPEEPQVILSHADDWSIDTGAQFTRLRVGAMDLRARPLQPGRCSALVVSMYFNTAKQRPANRRARFQVYVDGKPLLDQSRPGYDYFPSHLGAPTLFGHAPGHGDFVGRLSDPIIINSFLGMKRREGRKVPTMFGLGSDPPPAGPILERLGTEVCPSAGP